MFFSFLFFFFFTPRMLIWRVESPKQCSLMNEATPQYMSDRNRNRYQRSHTSVHLSTLCMNTLRCICRVCVKRWNDWNDTWSAEFVHSVPSQNKDTASALLLTVPPVSPSECMETRPYTCLRARCMQRWGHYTVCKVVNATQDKEWNRWPPCLAISDSITQIYYRVWASRACQSFVPAL